MHRRLAVENSRGGPSRAFVTLREHKALPILGRALDMFDSHPASGLVGCSRQEVTTPHPCLQGIYGQRMPKSTTIGNELCGSVRLALTVKGVSQVGTVSNHQSSMRLASGASDRFLSDG